MRTAAAIAVLILAAEVSEPLEAECTSSPTALCLQDRFEAEVFWVEPSTGFRVARAESFPAPVSATDTGYFWFTDERYVELLVKIVDACSFSDRFWVFAASLTDVEYTLRVTDTESPATVSYVNLAGERTVVQDTNALAVCPSTSTAGSPARRAPAAGLGFPTPTLGTSSRETEAAAAALPPCTPGETTLCLLGDRFQVEVDWETPTGSTGEGKRLPVTSHTGAFWFFNPSNVELMVKVVETCPAFEVHLSGFTNVKYTLQVTDTRTGQTWSYDNPQRTLSAVGDVMAFPRSCLFGDGFESGDTAAWFLP